MRQEFSTLLTESGFMTVKEVRQYQNTEEDIPELRLLLEVKFDENKFAKKASEKYNLTFIDLKNAKVSNEVLESIDRKEMIRNRVIPIQKTSSKLTCATFDPTIIEFAKKNIEKREQINVEIILTNISSWKNLFTRVKQSVEDILDTIEEVKGGVSDEAPSKNEDIGSDVVTFVNRILADAFINKVSDIHVEPYEKIFRVRFRVDGNLVEVASPPKSMMPPVVSRFKIMAQMDISEKRKPQDGRIKLKIAGKPIDYRVSSLPTLFGEKVVLRLLDSSNLQLDMTKLGFEPDQIKVFQEGIHRPYGMCLVTGPTGSGKTTTLYSAIAELNQPDTNISTAEDPVEFNLQGINQVNVRKEIGLTFASALKSFLRQDPDIIMVGEIRDLEVGEIAVEAALTGHMVLSTLHTNDACATITRMLNMGIEPFLVVAALNVVVAQRLCRKICINCKQEKESSVTELVACGFTEETAKRVKTYHGVGCDVCGGKGYKGRVAIYEVLKMSPPLRELVLRNASAEELKVQAIKDGMKTLRMCALTKVAEGMTTLEEAISNSASDD